MFIIHDHVLKGLLHKIALLSVLINLFEGFVRIVNQSFPESGYELALGLVEHDKSDSLVIKVGKRFINGRSSAVYYADLGP
jgi:hypothetical protein